MNLRIFYTLIVSIFLMAGNANASRGDGKYERLVNVGNTAYESFAFKKASEYYRDAFALNATQKVALKLASCYQKLNNTEEAITWYEKAVGLGTLANDDLLNFSTVLADAGRYDQANTIMKEQTGEGKWVEYKVEGFESIESFYRYKDAYTIQEAIFNTPASEFSPAFYEDGLVIVASRPGKNPLSPKYSWDNSSFLNLYQVKVGQPLEGVSKKLNTRYHEGPAAFYDNDTKVIFTRNQFDGDNSRVPGEFVNHLKLFYSEKKGNGKWKKPEMLSFNKEGFSYGHPALNEDGTVLYFSSDIKGGKGATDLYQSSFDGEKWSEPIALKNDINTEKDELFPSFRNGTLYFASTGHGGLGGLDIFKIDLSDPTATPDNIGAPINTKSDDFGLVWSADGKDGYFASNREGGAGSDDIYEFHVFDYDLHVSVTDAKTGAPLNVDISAQETGRNKTLASAKGVSTLDINALRGAELKITATAEGYEPGKLLVDTKNYEDRSGDMDLKISLSPIPDKRILVYAFYENDALKKLLYKETNSTSLAESNESVEALKETFKVEKETRIDNLLYGFDTNELETSATRELDKLVVFLTENKSVSVKLIGHSDSQGPEGYNLRLSKRRASVAASYLIEKGISKERISTEAKGESAPMVGCVKDCSEINHQTNRRTEIIIVLD